MWSRQGLAVLMMLAGGASAQAIPPVEPARPEAPARVDAGPRLDTLAEACGGGVRGCGAARALVASDLLAPTLAVALATPGCELGLAGPYPVRCLPPAAGATAESVLFGAVVPASNPVGVVPQTAHPPHGYARVWTDGRVNPSRGLPRAVSGQAVLGGAAGVAVVTASGAAVVAP